jgi:hypothetical protein
VYPARRAFPGRWTLRKIKEPPVSSVQIRAFPSKFNFTSDNTVKKEELTRKIRNCLLGLMDSSTKSDMGTKRIIIEWAQRIYVVGDNIGLFQSEQ